MIQFYIIEQFFSIETQKELAKTILKAQDIKELSYNVNRKHYEISNYQAAKKAIKEFSIDEKWLDVVANLNRDSWNEAQDWSLLILNEKRKTNE